MTITRISEIIEEKGQKTLLAHIMTLWLVLDVAEETQKTQMEPQKLKELCYSKVNSSWSRHSLKTGRKSASSRLDRGMILKTKHGNKQYNQKLRKRTSKEET